MRHALVEAVADLVGADDLLQFLDELVVDRVLHEDAVGTDTGLARVAILRSRCAFCSEREVRVVEDDHRRVAAQLHRKSLERVRTLLRQNLAHARRARERQLAHDGVAAYLVTDDSRGARRQYVEQAGGEARPVSQFGERSHRQRRLVRRFRDHRASDCECRRNLAGQHRRREIPRRDRGADADRLLDDDAATVGLRQRQHVTVYTLAFLGEPLDERGGVGDLAARLRQDLALFDRHQDGKILDVFENQLIPFLQDRGALHRRLCGPGLLRNRGSFDGATRLVRADVRDLSDHLVRRRVVNLEGRAAVGVHPFTVDIRLSAQKTGVAERPVDAGRFLECLRHVFALDCSGSIWPTIMPW